MMQAGLRVRHRAQQQAQELFHREICRRLDIGASQVESDTTTGGWRGQVNPAGQVTAQTEVPLDVLRDYAAALGLIWRQDAVGVYRLDPRGSKLAVVISRVDGRALSAVQVERVYQALWTHDAGKKATVGFTTLRGRMVFINAGELTEEEFIETMRRLAERHLTTDVYLDLARAEFELQSSDWSSDHGEGYRARLRSSGRSDLLDWVETRARREAEAFLEGFDWQARQAPRDPGRRKPKSR